METIETGHKTFDKQANALNCYIGLGNVWGSVQHSGFIRAFTETECNGIVRPEGHLQGYDFAGFKQLPEYVKRGVMDHLKTDKGILYEFRHWISRNKTVHCYILFDANHLYLDSWLIGCTNKSLNVLRVMRKHLATLAAERRNNK